MIDRIGVERKRRTAEARLLRTVPLQDEPFLGVVDVVCRNWRVV
jgi:hypothetical protein